MIPFGSQRGGGADLATHLMNAHDNERVALDHVRGAVADDLHGAFSEWEAQARALTRCRNYLYSLSVNPAQHVYGRLSAEQYADYIDRVEDALGLAGQPRAVVFHEKEDRAGAVREHAHVVWSRIDATNERAIPIAFDRSKLMEVTRAFARDHDLPLPRGYEDWRDRQHEKGGQETRNDIAQRLETGVSREERMRVVTELWQGRDTPTSFVRSLEDAGYVLATGRRDYVLVDGAGGTNALARMIDDRSVRAQTLRDFLGDGFAPDDLPSVEDAQSLTAAHASSREAARIEHLIEERRERLARDQGERRKAFDDERAAFTARRLSETEDLSRRFAADRDARRAIYDEGRAAVEDERRRRDPKGLWGTLAKASGLNFLRGQFQKLQDRRAEDRFDRAEAERAEQDAAERRALDARHALQAQEFERRDAALRQVEARERAALEQSLRRESAKAERAPYPHLKPVAKPARETVGSERGKTPPRSAKPDHDRAAAARHERFDLEAAFRETKTADYAAPKTDGRDRDGDYVRSVEKKGDREL